MFANLMQRTATGCHNALPIRWDVHNVADSIVYSVYNQWTTSNTQSHRSLPVLRHTRQLAFAPHTRADLGVPLPRETDDLAIGIVRRRYLGVARAATAAVMALVSVVLSPLMALGLMIPTMMALG